MRKLTLLLLALSLVAVGCMNADTHATADQEKIFQSRNTEIPPDIAKKMMENRKRAAEEYAQRSKAWGNPVPGQGGPAGNTTGR